jgi:hypothetical protein
MIDMKLKKKMKMTVFKTYYVFKFLVCQFRHCRLYTHIGIFVKQKMHALKKRKFQIYILYIRNNLYDLIYSNDFIFIIEKLNKFNK